MPCSVSLQVLAVVVNLVEDPRVGTNVAQAPHFLTLNLTATHRFVDLDAAVLVSRTHVEHTILAVDWLL